jgi:nucleotide-binding universal stress UspA family protein
MSQSAQSGAAASQESGRGQLPERQGRGANAVVLGVVDGAGGCRDAIVLAAREARYRNVPLIAVQAYSGERTLAGPSAPASTLRAPADDERDHAESNVRGALRDALGDLADGVEVRALLGLAGRRIVETAHKVNAELIVLATRGSASMLMGTVSQYVLRKASCPVLVVPVGRPVAQSAAR